MRELKFRAWDEQDKQMVAWVDLKDTQLLEEGFDGKECILMQFTGLLDKNNKEIYEGDIVEIQNPINQIQKAILLGTVVFSYGAFGIEINKVEKWESYNVDPPSIYWFINIVDSKLIDVKGNIYENTELLKGGNTKWRIVK